MVVVAPQDNEESLIGDPRHEAWPLCLQAAIPRFSTASSPFQQSALTELHSSQASLLPAGFSQQ